MKLIYEKPLARQIWDARMAARETGIRIEKIELSEAEMQKLAKELGHPPTSSLFNMLYGIPLEVVPTADERISYARYWKYP